MPMIPRTKIVLNGNKGASAGFIKFATAQLAILERQMSFQNLNEGRRVVTPFKGVDVECLSKFGKKEVRILTTGEYLQGGDIPTTKQDAFKCFIKITKKCLCLPHFSTGIIVATYPAQLNDESPQIDIDNYAISLLTDRFTYDVLVCNGEDFTLLSEVLDANYGRYYEGQVVMVSIANEMPLWENPLDCARACLLSSPEFEELSVSILLLTLMDSKVTVTETPCQSL
jgi:hypothetical protein